MRDFTLAIYKKLLDGLIQSDYRFITFSEFVRTPPGYAKTVILRHDVDLRPRNALMMAKLEKEKGIQATYYFRCQRKTFNETFIKAVAALGHEIGYHYETMDSSSGNIENAFAEFKENLESFKKLVPITSICRHGSPWSKWDNAQIWKFHDYKQLGIIGEPYIDIDFSQVLYLSDTGRKWINDNSNVRDKVDSGFKIKIRNTSHLISLINKVRLPDKLMINIHPQRWTDKPLPWLKELLWQNLKNGAKYFIVKGSNR